MNNGLSLTKVISGINKTLNVANQLIPLYKKVKPMISKSESIISSISNFTFPKKNNTSKSIKTSNTSDNGPVFFQ